MKKYMDENGLLYFWNKLKVHLENKVNKVDGKGLSTNDYTDSDKNKVSSIDSTYLKLTGGIMTGSIVSNAALANGVISTSSNTSSYINASKGIGATINHSGSAENFKTIISGNTTNGRMSLNYYQGYMNIGFENNTDISAGENSFNSEIRFTEDGTIMPVGSNKNLGSSAFKWANVYANTFQGNLNGNSNTATKLQNARTISLSGAVTGSGSFDGTSDISIDVKGGELISLDVSDIINANAGTNVTDTISVEMFNDMQSNAFNYEFTIWDNYAKSWFGFRVLSYKTESSFFPAHSNDTITIKYINEGGYISELYLYSTGSAVYIGGNSGGGGLACFTGDTLVKCEKETKPIKDLKIGDKVWSFNENENKTELKEIEKIYSHKQSEIYNISINNEVIRTTWSHPFYIKDIGRVLARDLKIGETTVDFYKENMIIDNIEKINTNELVYEILVKDNKNYYVGDNHILVYCENI